MTDQVTQDLALIARKAIDYIIALERKVKELQGVPSDKLLRSAKLLSIDDIAALCGVSRRTVADHWTHRPDFPAPSVAPSRRSRRWDRDEIIAWATPAKRKSAPRSLSGS